MTDFSIFVYGSFTEGLVHFKKIRSFVASTEKAKIKGSAYRLPVGFPALLEQGEDLISGHLLRIQQKTDLLLALLDQFHGYQSADPLKSLYHRKQVDVFCESNQHQTAFVYFLNPSQLPRQAVKIAFGDWQQSLQAQPALTDKMTQQQKSYILKLGSVVGREIVPIDLGLYRELMSLELIVDKGRRLALSKLGQEVFRFLQ